MKFTAILVFLFCSQVFGSEKDVNEAELKQEILRRLRSPSDTPFEADTKSVIAEYLISTVLEDNEILAFRRDKDQNRHHHRPHVDYRQPPPTAAPARVEPSIVQNNPIPVVAQSQPSLVPVANNQVVAAPVPAAVPVQSVDQNTQSRQDVTQVPILTAAPAAQQQQQQQAVTVQQQQQQQQVQGQQQQQQVSQQTLAPAATQPAVPLTTVTTVPPPTRPTVDPTHVYNQVDKILGSVATGNIVGIVDESLAIRAPVPVRNFVTGILKVIFCNPIDRVLGRCRPNSSGSISSVQGGK